MWKYLVLFAVILGLAFYVAGQDQHYTNYAERDVNHTSESAPVLSKTKRLPKEKEDVREKTPVWYSFFQWPTGTTTWAILVTLLAIAEQAKESRRAAQAAVDQIRMMKDKERARLVIRPLEPPEIGKTKLVDRQSPLEVTMHVANEGLTKAFEARAYAAISVTANKTGAPYEIGVQQDLPSTIRNTDDIQVPKIRIRGLGMLGNVERLFPFYVDEETVKALREGRMFLQISGLVTFTDIFEDSHEVPFRCLWVSQGDDLGDRWLTLSNWYSLSVSKEEVNADRRPQTEY